MNRLVREHYPVSKLPEDLREGFEGQRDVRVTIDAVAVPDDGPAPAAAPKTMEELFAMGRPTFGTSDEIDRHLRALREEWD